MIFLPTTGSCAVAGDSEWQDESWSATVAGNRRNSPRGWLSAIQTCSAEHATHPRCGHSACRQLTVLLIPLESGCLSAPYKQTMEACPSPPFCPEIANPVCVWPWSTGACREPGLSTPISDGAASHIDILSYGSVITRQACRTGRKECVCGVKGLSMGWSGEHRICHARAEKPGGRAYLGLCRLWLFSNGPKGVSELSALTRGKHPIVAAVLSVFGSSSRTRRNGWDVMRESPEQPLWGRCLSSSSYMPSIHILTSTEASEAVEPILTNLCQSKRERRDMPHSSGRQTGERIPTFCVDSEQHEGQTSRREV